MTEQNQIAQDSDETVKPLVDWAKPPTLLDLKQDLQDAKPTHDAQVQKISDWLDNLHVTGKAKVKTAEGSSSIVPKLIRKQAEWRYPALSEPFLSVEDIFKVKPSTWEDRRAAQQNQLVLNNQFNTKINKVKFIDDYVRAAVDEGTVICRVGWNYQDEKVLEEVPDVVFQANPAFAELHQQIAQLKAESPSQYATDVPDELKEAHDLTVQYGVAYEPVIRGTKMVEKVHVLANHPTVEVCNYRNVIFDPTCKGDISKAGFVIYIFESSLSQLEREGNKYKNLDKIMLAEHSPLNSPDHAASTGVSNFNFSDEPRKKIVVYEYWGHWDIDGTGITKPIVASWVGNTLIRLEDNPYPDKSHPFVVTQYLPVRESTYGEPDGVLIEDNQKIAGAVTRGMIDILGKSANGQTGIRKDMLDTTNKRRFERGQDYEFNGNVDPRLGVYMHTYPEIPNSAQFMLQLMQMEAESLTGVKSFSQGVSGDSLGEVAASVRGALDAASKRELGILRRLADGVVEIGRKFISMNAAFLSEEEVIRMTNEQFVKVRRDDLAGNFDLKLTISTAEEDEKKAQELAFMLQTMGNNMDPGMVKMILADIARLRKMVELAHAIEAYKPQPDPVQQKLQELEIAKAEMEIAKMRAETAKIYAEAGLSNAKAGTEQVKQGNIQSDTDQKNLDFVEQESGVKQERELQKHGEQARAQGELRLLDHYLTKREEKVRSGSK